ncbi:alpha/beta hydrolase [Microterricola viridarii]|uniref:Lysophospholipase n=1 Tax=Microterricola viridarii TaxID=412690 RepID=A0A109QXD6_9MICO|nr:alpha/beta fold hydrolase [Microterricola viridarii]AMB59762.1 lysophospholipase [Microterricola viridarii]
MPTPSSDVEIQSRTFTDEHGVRIHYYSWPVEQPRAVIQLAHGVGEHALRYLELVGELNKAGYSVYADDHRGHGRTGFEQHGGDLDRMGRLGPGGLPATIKALHQFSGIIAAEARSAHPGLPLVLLGHSWGSLMAQIIVNKHAAEYDAVILTGTAYRMVGSMESGDLNRRHKHLGNTGVEWLSRDPAVHTAFLSDPLTTTKPILKLFGPIDALRLLGRPARDLPADLPLLVQVGGDDSLGAEKSALKLVEAYRHRSGLSDVTLIVYPGARHEVFNEINRAEVMADTISWLNERMPQRP